MTTDYNYMRALWDQFYGRIVADPVCDEQHHHLSAQLPTDQRKELLKLIDCHYAHTDQITLESFVAGFRLATGIAKELSGGWYSFGREEEKQAGKP